ncbi:MAG TPA: hypothetical protein VGG95_05930, partial [Edaphobacter sp.]
AQKKGGQTHGFIYTNGKMWDLGTLGGNFSEALGINSKGQIVGDSITSDGSQHAFLFYDGVMTDLGKYGQDGIFQAGTGINENGQIVGYAQVAPGVTHAVVCTLTPGGVN